MAPQSRPLGTPLSTAALFVSFGSLYLAKLSYDLSAAKDQREIRDGMPAIDVQIRPAGVATASVTISIFNRAEINILPQDVTAEPFLQAGEFYFSSAQQGIDKLKSSLSLLPMGTVAPEVGTKGESIRNNRWKRRSLHARSRTAVCHSDTFCGQAGHRTHVRYHSAGSASLDEGKRKRSSFRPMRRSGDINAPCTALPAGHPPRMQRKTR